ncbi:MULTISPECIES: MFS transporter [Desulfitobacterium]|uniref:Arabinose efflux permease family protein n=1 Tax=Desulfitobacterium dehalogenans (strain ATCC 51507 / DSM 9161 / JW/IU-DC1) TaxID=756499 RepID=I4AES7_DESDJ|nr:MULTISPECIES: MFS transporter [Desulfitobacterium]AFM02462.1 arabinose efflux permease family protein [Desulfitobacterium dehalogenans ATCC 51507]
MVDNKPMTSTRYMDEATMNKSHYKFLILLAFGYTFEQIDVFSFSFVAPALTKYWGVSMEWIGLVNSCTFVGMLLGCWLGGWFADRIGRRKTFLGSILLFSLCSLVNGGAPNQEIFLVARTLTGIGMMGMVVVAMVYIAELLPAASRGKWQAIALATALLSIPLIGQLASHIIPNNPEGWRWILYIGGLGFIVLAFGNNWLKESPRWLISKGRFKEAEAVIQFYRPDVKVDLSAEASGKVKEEKAQETTKTLEVLRLLFSKEYRKKTLVLINLVVWNTVGYFMFFAWMPTLLNEYGFSLEDSLWMVALVSFGSPIGNYLAAFFTDKGGRKVPIVIYGAIIGVLTVIFGTIKAPMLIVGIGFIIRILMDGVFVLMWSYLAEAYPTQFRSSGTGIIFSTGRILNVGAMAMVPLIYKQFGYSVLFAIIGAMYIMIAVVTGIWGERTAGRSLEEIAETDSNKTVSA